jgi:hypothetical protein
MFVLNSKDFVKKGPRGNVFFKFLKIVFLGCSGEREVTQKHWLDKAKRTYTVQEVEDAKAVSRGLGIFLPLPFFWAVFFQMYSIWVFQAQEMNTAIGSSLHQQACLPSSNRSLGRERTASSSFFTLLEDEFVLGRLGHQALGPCPRAWPLLGRIDGDMDCHLPRLGAHLSADLEHLPQFALQIADAMG